MKDSKCQGCGSLFTCHGLAQHLAKTHRVRCHTVHLASQPQSVFRSHPYEQPLLPLTANSTLLGLPDRFFGRGQPSGHGGTPSDSPAVPPLGEETVTTGDMDDCKLQLHQSGPYTNPAIAMGADDASNSANDQANNTTYGDSMPDTTNMTDTNVFESITQTQPSGFLDMDSTASDPEDISSAESESPPENLSDPEDILSAKSESPPENLSDPEDILSAKSESAPENPRNLLEPSSADTHSQLVAEHFPYGKPGAPINGMQGSSIYKSSQDALGGAVWSPFQLQCDWDIAYWAKMNRPSCSALTDLLSVPNVRYSFVLFTHVAECGLSL